MRFHVHLLPTYFPRRDPPFAVYYQQLLEQVALAEELGWESFWFTEHHFHLHGGPVPNPVAMMSAASARTSRIRLGSAISVLPLHHPIQIAEDYAMVDVLSGGRLDFGIGQGNTPADFAVYGIDRDESRPRFEEAADVVVKAWTRPRLHHAGRFWRFDDVTIYPRPIQRPAPPVWVAGRSAATLAWAGRHGFHIMILPGAQAAQGVAAWREALAGSGGGHRERLCKLHVRAWVDDNGKRARRVAEEALVRYHAHEARDRSPAPAVIDVDSLRATGRNVYGDPDECIATLQWLRGQYDFDVCSTSFNFGGLPHREVMRAMRRFASDVMPAFTSPRPLAAGAGEPPPGTRPDLPVGAR